MGNTEKNNRTTLPKPAAFAAKGLNLPAAEAGEMPGILSREARLRPLWATFRNILLVVFLIFVCAIVQMLILWQVCNTGMKTAASLENQGLPTLNGLAQLQEDLAVYRLNAYEYLFAREGEKAGRAKAVQDSANQTRTELEKIRTLLPADAGRQLASNLESAFNDLNTEFRKIQDLVDSDFAAAMKAMDHDIPPLTERVTIAAKAFSDYGYHFSGGQANATFASFAWIKKNAIMFGALSILVAFSAVLFVQRAARRSRMQLLQTMERLDERTGELANSQALYQSLVDQLPAGIFRKDAAGRFVFVNAWFCRAKQMDASQILGRTALEIAADELKNPATKWHQATTTQADVHHQLIMRTGERIEVDEQNPGVDGIMQYLRATKTPVFDSAGRIVGSQGILLDVTERMLSEVQLAYERDLLQTLLEHAPDSIYFKDTECRFLKASESQARLVGLKSVDELIGKSDFDFFTEEHARPAFEDEQTIIRTGQPMIGKVEKEILKNGQESWALTSKMPLHDKAGKIIGTFGISKNITVIKETEAKLAQMHKQLLETSRQAGMAEIATNVLHNIGNVLNSVNVSASVVANGVKKSKSASLVKVVALLREQEPDLGTFFTSDPRGRQLPAYLAQLTEHFLDEQKANIRELNLLQSNIDHIKEIVAMQQSYAKVSGVKEIINLNDLVEDCLRMNDGAMNRHQVEVVREFGILPPMNVEKHKILQILVNLVRNSKHACQDSMRSGRRLIVRTRHEAGQVRISVMDNGVGIPPENLTRIFNHGFTTRKDGHGFGLHSGALAAKEMDGSLTVHSDGPGQGATFILELPGPDEREHT